MINIKCKKLYIPILVLYFVLDSPGSLFSPGSRLHLHDATGIWCYHGYRFNQQTFMFTFWEWMLLDSGNIISDETFYTQSQIMVEKVPEFSAESLCLRQGMVTIVVVGVTWPFWIMWHQRRHMFTLLGYILCLHVSAWRFCKNLNIRFQGSRKNL